MPELKEMNYCPVCGQKLVNKYLPSEGKEIPYCEKCQDFRFPRFNVAVSMIVMNEKKDRILLIRQYGKERYILVAGYVNPGEEAEAAVIREVKEETGLEVTSLHFNHSHYFAPSETLMLNFTVTVKGEIKPDWEIDSYKVFTLEEARKNIARPSLAQEFLDGYLTGEYHFSK